MYVSEQEWYQSRASMMQTPSEGLSQNPYFQKTLSQNEITFNQTGKMTLSTYKMEFGPKVDQNPENDENEYEMIKTGNLT